MFIFKGKYHSFHVCTRVLVQCIVDTHIFPWIAWPLHKVCPFFDTMFEMISITKETRISTEIQLCMNVLFVYSISMCTILCVSLTSKTGIDGLQLLKDNNNPVTCTKSSKYILHFKPSNMKVLFAHRLF